MTHDQFRILEEISGKRGQPNSRTDSGSKADDLLAAAIAAFAVITRPGRQDLEQFEDLALPLMQCATPAGKRHAAEALAKLGDAPRRLIIALASQPVEISAPLLLRSPLLHANDLIDIIGKNGLAHARVIARRPSGDVLLKGILHSFADPVIDRTLAIQEKRAEDEPLEKSASRGLATMPQQPLFHNAPLPGAEHLIDTALLIDDRLFRHALADALDLSFERTESVIGQWPDSHLPIALRALGLSAAECYLIMTAVLGPIDANRDNLREFVYIYRSIDREKAMTLVRRWKAEDMSAMLRNKLREMAKAEDETALMPPANSDTPPGTVSL